MSSEAQNKPEILPETLVELLLHLGRLAQTNTAQATKADEGPELSAAQWTVLRYLDNANLASRTPSAFAKFHGTTRGTASQTIRGLIKRGYLTQNRAARDKRSKQLDLTEKARAMRPSDPFEAVVRAANDLPVATRRQFAGALQHMLNHVAGEKDAQPFGNCTNCTHMECVGHRPGEADSYHCAINQGPLDVADLARLCVNFQPAKAAFSPRATT
jgi:DNA-binding MarR family transcriptional regulator